jgi:CubicO group peptidase (beta-lactamase class C family)
MARRRVAALALGLVVLVSCRDDTTEATGPTTTAAPTSTTAETTTGPFPAQPDGVPWPTEAWARGELPPGVDRTVIDAATDTAFAGGAADRVRATVIVHGGAVVYERYAPNPDDGPDVIMPSYSVAKSVTMAAIGLLVDDGRLDLDAPAPVPEWHEDPEDPEDPRAEITIRQMLEMRTGVPWEDGLEAGTEMSTMIARDDMAHYAASLEATSTPGTTFDYNTGTTMLLARIVGDTVGGGEEGVRNFLDDELFGPLGIGPVELMFDDAGTWAGGFSADMTAEDDARFGLLFLRGGQWDGQQLLSETWVELARTPSDTANQYAHHWWYDELRPGVSYAIGIRGQVITVDPADDLVIVQLSTVPGQLPLDQTEAILAAFTEAR